MTCTVLIVDDSKLARIVVAKAVTAIQPDWKKIEAGNAEEASALLREGGIDLAILDFNMPGRNGLDLAQQIRGKHPEMPIALATANLQDEIISQAHTLNATFVAKPITEDGLRPFLSGAALRLRRKG
ncbi:MAG: response regulator [Caulobacteraceae bacterium]|nr:response regulator [Caulobacteraceae bacterium]